MSSSSDETILPAPRRPINSGGLDGDTVLPSLNAAGIHVPGDVIDNRYSVIREIGRGGMGVVYEVEDAVTSDRYAVKRLLPEYSSRSEIVEVFRSEGAASMRFTNKSPRFVSTQTVNLENGLPYIVLQLVKQPTLRTILQSTVGGRLLLADALPILRDIAVALSELHDLGYVHRDLKPENIFVDYSDGNPTVMLVDFGLTKDIDYATRTVMRGAGTERYASPEQMRGDATTPATDVYAFGVIAYELLTGELPRYGESLTDYAPDASEPLVSLVSGCLAGRVDKRVANGSAVVQRMREIQLASNEVAATPELLVADIPKKQPELPLPPTKLTSLLRFPDLQSGSNITVDGVAIAPGADFVCELPAGTAKKVAVIATWEGVDLYRGAVDVRAGETKAITTLKAYRIDCDVPTWCEVNDVSGQRVVFPVTGVVSESPVAVVFPLLHQRKEFDKLTLTPTAGVQIAEIPYGIGTIQLADVPSGCVVRINENVVANPYSLPIGLGKPVSLSVRVYDATNNEIFAQTCLLKANTTSNLSIRSEPTHGNLGANPSTDFTTQVNVVRPNNVKPNITRRVFVILGGTAVITAGYRSYFCNATKKSQGVEEGLILESSSKFPQKNDVKSQNHQVIRPFVKRRVTRGKFPYLDAYLRDMVLVPSFSGKNFALGATPVTVGMWKEYVSDIGSSMPPTPSEIAFQSIAFNPNWSLVDHPIVNIKWHHCRDYCQWASIQSSIKLNVPFESEWEHGCRGGTDTKYQWGSNWNAENVWCSRIKSGDVGSTGSVKRKESIWLNHPFGLVDMIGNVWEWCNDVGHQQDIPNEVMHERVIRGGSWFETFGGRSSMFGGTVSFEVSTRATTFPTTESNIGFRIIARDID